MMFEETEENSITSLLDGLVISNRYEVIRCLGSGAMGSVHLARDRLLSGNVVALKVLKRQIADDQNVRQRFLQEVKLMHRVNHPNVVRTYDVGVDHDLIYFTMEYVTGVSLEKLVEEGGIDLELFIDISLQICAGLGQIHAADIIHRDLKPANVMLADGKVKIADFGVARSSRSELTQHKEIIGSTPYIAPEIWMGGKLTSAADFYSLGAIFFELLIGHPPFEHDIPATIMWMHLKKSPDEPKSLRPEIPEWLNALILRMLAKSPENRPSSAEEIYNYIHKRSNISKNTVKEEKSDLDRNHYCSVDAEIVSNLANSIDDELAIVSSGNSDLFVISSAQKSFDKNSYTGIAIKEYIANAFNAEGLINSETLNFALTAANNILLNKRRENPDIAGISASLSALAITPTEILFSFAGNCGVFISSQNEFLRLNSAFPESSSWTLGTTLPLTTETHKIPYSPGQPLRVLLATNAILDSVGGKEIETRLNNENFAECIGQILAETVKRKPHLSAAMLLFDLKVNPPHCLQVAQGQVVMSLFSFDPKSREMKTSDYHAYFNQDELDKTYKALTFEEVEKPKNILFEDPKESIIFKSLPSTEEIIKQQESLAQFSKQRLKKMNEESIASQQQKYKEFQGKQTKIFIVIIVGFVLFSAIAVLLMFGLQKSSSQQTLSNYQTKNTPKAIESDSKFISLMKLSNILQNLSKKSKVELTAQSNNSFLSNYSESNINNLKQFANEVHIESFNLLDVFSGVAKFSSISSDTNNLRYQNELKLAELKTQLKVLQSSGSDSARSNLVTAQREYHTLDELVKLLSPNIINQRKRFVFWQEYAQKIEQNAIIALAQELALRKWSDSPRTSEAQEVWQNYQDIMSSGAQESLEVNKVKEVIDKLNNIVAEVVQIGLKNESENLIKMLLLLEEARFKREIKQVEINNWRKAMKAKPEKDLADLQAEINKLSNELQATAGKDSYREMLIYRVLETMDIKL